MSAAGSCLTEDQFLCSICLDVFTNPVSTPCGHNFCKNCITQHWDINVHCVCPICKKKFYPRPELQVNTFVSEMVVHFRQSAQQRASRSRSEQQAAKPGDVPCDVCSGTKLKALKSCLVCLVSYCETHLEPHLTTSGLKRHQLVDPVKNLEGRMCMKHNKPLELFCKSDQTCVCMLCSVLDHKAHNVVPLKEEYERKKIKVAKREAEIQQMIQGKRGKIQKFKHSIYFSRENANREIADSVHIFTKLKEAIERNQAKVIQTIEEKLRVTEKQAEGFIKELEQEICELKKRSSELEQLSHCEDHLHLLQNFPPLNTVSPTKNWSEVKVRLPSHEGTMKAAVAQLADMLKNEMKKLLPDETISSFTMNRVKIPDNIELKRVQQYAVDVTFDPDTAHRQLILSDDLKQVHDGIISKNLPENPKRFSAGLCVLGKQTISSGRFYFEVQLKGNIKRVVGVARESVSRKEICLNTRHGCWTIWLQYSHVYPGLSAVRDVPLSLKSQPEKVGVFVSYEEGLVSFYDVDAGTLIYSFTGCCFGGKLLPFFSPCLNQLVKNPPPLIICPVNPT